MATARIQGSLRSAVSKTTKTINQTQTMPNPKISKRCKRRLSNLTISAPQAGKGDRFFPHGVRLIAGQRRAHRHPPSAPSAACGLCNFGIADWDCGRCPLGRRPAYLRKLTGAWTHSPPHCATAHTSSPSCRRGCDEGSRRQSRFPADEFIGRARQQIEKPVLVGRIYREDIYQADHAVRSSLLLPEALPIMKG
jgi:hypothetical protein